MNVLVLGKDNQPSRVLSGRTPDPGTTLYQSVDLGLSEFYSSFIRITANKSKSRLIRQPRDGPGAKDISLPKKFFCILMDDGLIITGEIQVNIWLLVTVEPHKGGKGDVLTVFDEVRSTVRTSLGGQVIP